VRSRILATRETAPLPIGTNASRDCKRPGSAGMLCRRRRQRGRGSRLLTIACCMLYELYGIPSGIPLRSLRNCNAQSESLVCNPVQRRESHCFPLERRYGECRGSTALLWRSARSGVHQPLVRLHLFAAEAGFRETHQFVSAGPPVSGNQHGAGRGAPFSGTAPTRVDPKTA